MSTTDEIMALVDKYIHAVAGDSLFFQEARESIEARVAALVKERDIARDSASVTGTRATQAEQRIATLEAENRALRGAGYALCDFKDKETFTAAWDIFTGQPGALEAWLGKEKGDG